MVDDLTPWEDINPPMVSAPQPAPPPRYSDWLAPADAETFGIELTACLALVAPVGMDEAARREWLAVAWETLKHLPADILSSGCRIAREKCDHPSKIVPTIIAETKADMGFRQRAREWDRPLALPAPEPEYCTAEEAAKILAQYGLRYAPDTAA